jgi:AcrR family transcriptional regulator
MPKVVPEYKEEARKKIINAGLEVMIQKGYCITTMDDIAAHLGVSKGALYLYFKNKDELVAEIVRNLHAKTHETAKMIFPNTAPLEAWSEFFDRGITLDPKFSALFFEIAAMAVRNETIRKSYSEDLAHSIEMATHGITYQQRAGLVRPDTDPRTLAIAIISIFSGMKNLAISGVDPIELRERWIEIGRILLGIHEDNNEPGEVPGE